VGRRRVRASAAAAAAAVVASVAVALGHDDGLAAHRVLLGGGSVWLASPWQGVVTLVDGAAEQVVGSVRVPAGTGADFAVVPDGSSAYLIGAKTGTVSRVDGGTYDVTGPVDFGGGGPLQVFAGGGAVYVVAGARQAASVVDPTTLRVRDELALAASPGAGQSVVDDDGRLWVVDQGGVAWFDGAGKHVRPDAGGAGARLLLVAGRAWIADLGTARAAELTPDGKPLAWSCLDVPAGTEPRLLGTTALGRVVAAVPKTGSLVIAGIGRDECGRSVRVGRAGDEFGGLVETSGYVLVPDWTSGRATVVDVAGRRVVADLPVVDAGHHLELVAKDGVVFYNDLDGDRAGVLRLDGTRWTVGKALAKFRAGGAGILVAAGTAGQPKLPVPKRPDPRRPDADRPDPAQPSQQDDPANPAPDTPLPPGALPPTPPEPESPAPNGPDGPGAPPTSANPSNPTGPALPGAPPVHLTVHVTGAGTVTAAAPTPLNAAAGVTCAADSTCDWTYAAGTQVTLTVPESPTPDVLLTDLTGCTGRSTAAGTTTCTVTMTAAATVTAAFAARPPDPVTLTVTGAGAGIVGVTSPGPPQTCSPTCTVTVDPGTDVQIAADPATGNYLSDWGDPGCATTGQTCTVHVVADHTVRVAFAPLLDLTINLVGDGQGAVGGAGISCGAPTSCHGSYRAGTVVTMTAAAADGSMFSGWTGCAASGLTCTITMNAAHTVAAAFSTRRDGTPPAVSMSALGKTVGIGTGGAVATADNPTQVTVTAAGTDPDSPVTGTEIWGSISGTCLDGVERPVSQGDGRLSIAAGGGTSYDLTAAAASLCNPARVALVFKLRARAGSEGGTSAFTDELTISWNPGLIN
jgi:Divergent InlB B-repeat domain